MARMKRVNITIDIDTINLLKRWKVAKEKPASEVIREAVAAYSRWKKDEIAAKAQEFEGVDVTYEYE